MAVSGPLGLAPTNDILAGDVNRDGSNDLVFVNATGVHQIWNRSGNTFVLHSEQIVAANALSGVVAELGMTDVGEPGGVDLTMGGAPVPGAGVYLNDSFGNLGRGDAVAPELTLNGDNPMSIPASTAFVDPRATATDNIDGRQYGSIDYSHRKCDTKHSNRWWRNSVAADTIADAGSAHRNSPATLHADYCSQER